MFPRQIEPVLNFTETILASKIQASIGKHFLSSSIIGTIVHVLPKAKTGMVIR
jgi:hypothetical protein